MNRSVAVITIGQTPRTDVMPELERFLGPDVRVVEAGALDDLTKAEVEAIAPETTGSILVTRLRDGSEVKLGEDFVFPHTQECIRRVEHQVDLILLLCTGSFPRLDSRKLILYPDQILFNVVRGVGARRIGVFTPAPEQLDRQLERWSRFVAQVAVQAASPYGSAGQLENALLRFDRNDLDLVVTDCVGYTHAMKSRVRDVLKRPVLLARSVAARITAELIA